MQFAELSGIKGCVGSGFVRCNCKLAPCGAIHAYRAQCYSPSFQPHPENPKSFGAFAPPIWVCNSAQPAEPTPGHNSESHLWLQTMRRGESAKRCLFHTAWSETPTQKL